ncbi:uncharacterized protein LOC109827368 [Asparagus officinalis]|uniref:uncharacterized protein LOC109827368 n=1 Tax=Asparagus officinalis TaxID=4686 RepID=UPI00098E4133|nr:uncharacterized protein LOC109827368 [Asparagus officinalis]
MASSEPKPSKSRSKDKRKRPQLHQQDETLDQQQASAPKKAKSSSPWANLDLILSLQRNDLDIQRKVELASEFISSDVGISDARRQPVSVSRLASFLTDWIQPLLIPREKSSGLCVHCLDCRCWAVLRFCLKNSQFAVSLNLLKSAAQVFKYSEGSADGKRLFESVLECFELILSANPRAFYNASMDLWRPCVVEIVGSVHRCSGNGDHDVVLRLAHLLLGHFVNFLRFHKDPTNIFSKFVDGLLEPLLELLVLLHLRTKGGVCGQFGSLLRLVEDVLSNGLFHPTNIGGFFSLKSSIAEQKTWTPKGHREFFKKLGNIITDKKAMVLRGFGYLFRLFITSTKSQKGVSLAAKSDQALAKNSETSDERKETSKPLFEVFVQFMQPLVLECKRCSERELSKYEEGLEDRLLEAHGMLKSLNETLVSFIQEKIYIRTEDTSDGGHYNFLKEVYGTIVLISGKIYQLWLSTLDMDGGRVKKMLPLVAREVVVAVGYFLEIEYKVVEDDLVKLWVMMVSFLAVYLSVEDTQPSSPLTSDILNLGYRLINIYSELRQVSDVFSYNSMDGLPYSSSLIVVISIKDIGVGTSQCK